jgi:biotin transport system substrate-specific component
MLQALPIKREQALPLQLAGIVFFVALTALSARISIPLEPVPFTMQVLAVLLSGMVLGAWGGGASQAIYVGLIIAGMPIDAAGKGSLAFFGSNGGYFVGFIVAAFVVGFLTQRGKNIFWVRWIAGVVGVVVIYLFGALNLSLFLGVDMGKAFTLGVQPFILLDAVKALLAAGLTEGMRKILKVS